ncbi:MAG: transporter substrate-binding domain-containing protein [Acidobacteriota bacterium]
MIKKSVIFVLLIFVAGLMNYQNASGVDLEKIKSSGKIVVGTSADYPPYEFFLMNDKENELVGLDIDIANVIAKELGVKVEIKNLIFHKLFSVLESGEVDILIAGLNPTYARTRIADFSDIYYKAIQNLVIRKVDKEKIAFLKDLRGKTVGTQKGSIQSEMAPTQIPGAKFMYFDSIPDLVNNLKKGVVDAVLMEKPVAISYVKRNTALISVECLSSGTDDSPLGSAIAVKKGNKKLLKKINDIIHKLKKENKIEEFIENAKILLNKR